MQRLVSILAVGALVATASAQSIVIPNGLAATEGNSSNAFPWGRGGTGIRIQTVYDSSHFTLQGINFPILITGLRWRPNGNVGLSASSYTALTNTVKLSTCPLDQNAVSTTMANNEGADVTTCFTGSVSWGAQPVQAGPTPFGIVVPFTTNFLYDPTLGDLNIECEMPIQTFTGVGPQLDVQTTGSLASRTYITTGYPGTGIGVNTLVHGVVVQVDYVPASGLYAGFTANVTTGPSPLAVNFTDNSYSSDPGGITGWAWDFDGDNIIDSNLQNPSFVYTNCGTYDVTLTITDASHSPSTLTKTAYIKTDEIVASFTAAVLVAPNVFQFTDTSTPAATAWDWDFDGDNITDSIVQNPVWSMPLCESSPVRLIATRNCQSDTATQSVNVIGSNNTATSSLTGGNGNSSATYVGNMFDISVTNPQGINICGLAVTPYSFAGPFTMSVYVTPGTYVGNNLVASRWRLIGTGDGVSTAGPFTNPTVIDVAMGGFAYLAPGNYGVAVYLNRTPLATTNIAYTNGPIGPFANADVTLFPSPGTAPGIATLGLFSGSITASRAWNGRIYYSTIANGGDAGYGFFAPGCAGSMGVSNLQHANRPQLGTTMTVNVNNLPLSVAIMMVGFSRTTSMFGALPLDLTTYGAPGCFGRVSPDATAFLIGAGNAASWLFGVPNDPSLMALPLFTQALVPDPGFNTLGAVFSDAAALIIGT